MRKSVTSPNTYACQCSEIYVFIKTRALDAKAKRGEIVRKVLSVEILEL